MKKGLMNQNRILFIFFDGVGIGKKDSTINPFFSASLPTINKLLDNKIPHLKSRTVVHEYSLMRSLDANLGVAGLPQSGTGQTALLCGFNAPKFIGKHFGPYLYSELRPKILEKNIFKILSRNGTTVFYANAYPPRYFEYIETHKTRRTATTLAWTLSGFELNDHKILKKGEALAADITNERWNAMGFPHMPEISIKDAGIRLVEFLEKYNFVFYEYFFTDHAGHSQSMEKAKEELEKIDTLLSGIMEVFDHKSMTLILTSDHGNIEDLSTKAHTRNPVPFFVIGKEKNYFSNPKIKNITQIVPAISGLF